MQLKSLQLLRSRNDSVTFTHSLSRSPKQFTNFLSNSKTISNSSRKMSTCSTTLDLLPLFTTTRSLSPPLPSLGVSVRSRNGGMGLVCKAMVQQQVYQGGASANYAKQMERLSAKESLLLAFKDSGGFQSLVGGKITDVQRIDVNERIIGLERLNPTPRPTTSPFLEGQWEMEWLGSGNSILSIAKLIFERSPSTLATFLGINVVIKDGYSKAIANMKLLNSIENKFTLTSKLTVEGPLRMKEESVDCVLETPTVSEESVPEQLKGAFSQALSTLQQLPGLVKDVVASGLKVPLNGTVQRLFMISYLDEEIIILRDTAGVPEVLTRLDAPVSPLGVDPMMEYQS